MVEVLSVVRFELESFFFFRNLGMFPWTSLDLRLVACVGLMQCYKTSGFTRL
jgi:hypothetical protein